MTKYDLTDAVGMPFTAGSSSITYMEAVALRHGFSYWNKVVCGYARNIPAGSR